MAIAGTLTYKTELDTSGVKKSGSTVKSIIAGLGITKMISKAMSVINSSIGDAVKRVDTLNNFPKVMSNLGVSAKDADKSIKLMSDKLAGLPTTLDQGAMAVQRFTSANGDVAKSTDIFLALNNAILAGGASTEIQATALEQMSQAYAKGKPDMMEWRTLMTAMPAQLKQVATAMGYVSADELGEELRKGNVSMDDFMDTVVKLNKKGVKGFQSFEKQAKNSTAGISTSVTVAKTQVVKGLADIITGIDKGLKKSGTSISKIISDIGKKSKEALDKVANALSKVDFNKLFKTIQSLIPVVATLTAGFVAYNVALKAIELKNAIVGFGQLITQLLTLSPALTTATIQTTALNTALTISPIGLVVAGVAGLTAGLVLLGKATKDTTDGQSKLTDRMVEYEQAMDKADKTRQRYLDKHMNEIRNTEDLYKELQLLVDENGKVKDGYEDRVKFITNELNNALGTEIKMTNGIIEGYDGVKKSIADLLKSKRAKILLDAEEAKYNEAMNKRNQLEKDFAQAQKTYNDNLAKRTEILRNIQEQYGLTDAQLGQVQQSLSYVDENGQRVNIAFEELGQQLSNVDGKLISNKNRLDEIGGQYASNEKIIGDYKYAMEQMAQGNYDAVEKMYTDTTNYHDKVSKENGKSYQAEIDSQKAYLDYLKANKGKYEEDVYNEQVKATEKRIKQLEDEQKKSDATVKAGQSTIKGTWNKSLAEQLSTMTGKTIEFRKTADGHIQAYIDGEKAGAPMTKKEAKKMADNMTNEMKKAKTGSTQAGKDFTAGTTSGIKSGQGGTFSAVRSYGNSILQTLKNALKEHSPSKASREMGLFLDQGVELGIKDGERNTLKTVSSFGSNVLDELSESMDFNKELEDMYKEMNKTIKAENAKLSFDVSSNDIYNKSIQLPAVIDLNAQFDGTLPVELNLDGEKVWENQQKISIRKSVQYGGGK